MLYWISSCQSHAEHECTWTEVKKKCVQLYAIIFMELPHPIKGVYKKKKSWNMMPYFACMKAVFTWIATLCTICKARKIKKINCQISDCITVSCQCRLQLDVLTLNNLWLWHWIFYWNKLILGITFQLFFFSLPSFLSSFRATGCQDIVGALLSNAQLPSC